MISDRLYSITLYGKKKSIGQGLIIISQGQYKVTASYSHKEGRLEKLPNLHCHLHVARARQTMCLKTVFEEAIVVECLDFILLFRFLTRQVL